MFNTASPTLLLFHAAQTPSPIPCPSPRFPEAQLLPFAAAHMDGEVRGGASTDLRRAVVAVCGDEPRRRTDTSPSPWHQSPVSTPSLVVHKPSPSLRTSPAVWHPSPAAASCPAAHEPLPSPQRAGTRPRWRAWTGARQEGATEAHGTLPCLATLPCCMAHGYNSAQRLDAGEQRRRGFCRCGCGRGQPAFLLQQREHHRFQNHW